MDQKVYDILEAVQKIHKDMVEFREDMLGSFDSIGNKLDRIENNKAETVKLLRAIDNNLNR